MCDNVGVWHEDLGQASFHIGEEIDKDRALELFNGRIKLVNNKRNDEIKWFIVDFCDYQYGKLDEKTTNKAHLSYINALKKHGLWKGHGCPLEGAQEKEKEKEKDKDKEKEKEYAPFVSIKEEEYNDLCNRFGKKVIDGYIENISDFQLSTGKRYKDIPATIKNWMKRKMGVDSIKDLELQEREKEKNKQINKERDEKYREQHRKQQQEQYIPPEIAKKKLLEIKEIGKRPP